MRSLMELVSLVAASRDYADLLEVMAEECRRALRASTVSLSVWERDRGTVRTLVNAGALTAGQEPRPADEVYSLADHPLAVRMFTEGTGYVQHRGQADGDAAVARLLDLEDKICALGVPIHLDGRVWGELWATRAHGEEPFGGVDLEFGRLVAAQVGAGIAQAEHLQRVERLVYTDDLTGLANRRAFEDRLDVAFAHHREHGTPVGVVVVDVNGLKQINDTQGHSAGDHALTSFAAELAIAANALPDVMAARLGGDEFCILAVGLPAQAVQALAEDVCRRGQHVLELGVACGVATTDGLPSQSMTGSRLLRAADAAQYRAKRSESSVPVVAGHRGLGHGPDAEDEPDRRAFRGRGSRSPSHLVDETLRRLDHAPDAPAAERLALVAQAVAETVDAAGWFVSRVGDATITTVDSAVARAVPDGTSRYYSVDEFPVDDYPASYAAASGQAVYVGVEDPSSDPAEVALLAAGSLSEMLMTGGPDGAGARWLLEVTGDELSSSVRPYVGVARALAAVALRR
jgi:diguanylate cyclase (GGDEF)-like protein